MKQRKVLVGIAIAIFIILLLYWLLVAEDMKPLVVGYGSFRGTTILRLILTGFG
ncbi:hypothetical protein NXX23_27760 [Bacteroides ovatus]|nr:hypothetical protein [Bacteroides ovatus]